MGVSSAIILVHVAGKENKPPWNQENLVPCIYEGNQEDNDLKKNQLFLVGG